jgi:LemA protein
MIPLFVFLGLLAVIAFWVIGIYNGLVKERNEVKNSFSQIDVQLKRRHDLIPNLIQTVKGYMQHEQETLEKVTQMRQQAVNLEGIENIQEKAKIENMLSSTLKSLFAVTESYPDLKANENFIRLQEELTTTENKISFSRQYYNDAVMHYNNRTEMFPSNIIAGMFNFEPGEFFEVEEETERAVPEVKF